MLIAEDFFDLAKVIGMLLKRCGFDVRPAHDGATVLAMALKFRPHFILLDIKLPGIGGYELAGSLREDATQKGSIIVGISAYRPIAQSGIYM